MASPTGIGAWLLASASICSPPARRKAPATPPPISPNELAALTTASALACVISPCWQTISISVASVRTERSLPSRKSRKIDELNAAGGELALPPRLIFSRVDHQFGNFKRERQIEIAVPGKARRHRLPARKKSIHAAQAE